MVSDNNEIAAKASFYAPEAKILVVDDTRMNLIVLMGLLKQTGIQIDTATSGRECLLLAEKGKYHIIFLDIRMPDMDGNETLSRLLELEAYKNKSTPVIALTANSGADAREEYTGNGFSDYLSKPIDAEKLVNIILKYLPGELVGKMNEAEMNTPVSVGGASELLDIAGLKMAIGIATCGTAETFQKALKEFYLTSNERLQEINNYLHTENYNDFTIKVHALKSSALIIGAEKLSEMARYLEECGDNENIPEINKKTPELIEYYTELVEAIGAYINERTEKRERPLIEHEGLIDAFNTIYECVQCFDFDSADSIMEMLDEYAIPDEYHDVVQKLKVLLIDIKRDDILRLLDTIEKQAPSEPRESDAINIPNIDVNSALLALGGSVEEYINILKVFTEDEEERIKQMDECLRTENMELYTVYAHSIKGSAAIIGAAELSELAEQLEMAGKERNIEYIRGSHNEFVIKTNNVIKDLICFLQQRSGSEKQEKEQGSKETLLECLAVIEASLMDYEMNVAEEAIKRLKNMEWSKAITVMISDIEQKMRTFDYEDAWLLVGQLLKMEEKEYEGVEEYIALK